MSNNESPSKEFNSVGQPAQQQTHNNLPRDFSRLSLFSTGGNSLASSCSSSSHSSCQQQQDEHFRWEGHAEHSLSCMRKYLQADKLCDVTLIAGSATTGIRKVKAHRLVLSAASEYFAAMFTGSLAVNSQQSEITLVDVNGDVLQSVVNYCYTGSIEIREDNVETLLATSCLMLLHEVVEACSQFLVHQLHPSNCLGIAVFAEHQSCKSLLEKSKAFTAQHFMQVIDNQEFLQLNVDQLCQLLDNEELNVPSEESIFHAVVNWIQYQGGGAGGDDDRSKHISQLLSLIKLPLLSPAFLTDFVEPFISTTAKGENASKAQQLIMEAMKWHLLPERRSQLISQRTRPRKSTLGRLLVVGGMDKYKGATTIESYDPRLDVWTNAYSMSGRRLQFGIALMDDKLLVVGGRDGLKTLNIMECLDLEKGEWSQLTPMNTHRHGLGVAVLGGTLYAVGGHDGWSYLNTVERWDPMTRSWQYVAPMTNQRCSAGIAVLDGKLYAVGGRDGASCLRTVECYDPHTNKWVAVAPLTCRRGGVGVAVANGYLYAMGGQDAPANNPAASRFDCVERYDPKSDTWTSVAPLSSKRDAVAACLFGDKLYAIGGYDGCNYLRTVEQYDSSTNEWHPAAPLLTGRAGACTIAISNHILNHNNKNHNKLTKE